MPDEREGGRPFEKNRARGEFDHDPAPLPDVLRLEEGEPGADIGCPNCGRRLLDFFAFELRRRMTVKEWGVWTEARELVLSLARSGVDARDRAIAEGTASRMIEAERGDAGDEDPTDG